MRGVTSIGSQEQLLGRTTLEPYPLAVRALAAGALTPTVDLRDGGLPSLDTGTDHPWICAIESVRRVVAGTGGRVAVDTIKRFDRDRGAGQAHLDQVLHALDHGRPVAFYGWWPTSAAAATTEILGVDAMEVPPPDRKRAGLVDGHAVVIIGYGRHDAFPGGGYLIVRSGWKAAGWGDGGDGYMPFTYARAYASELCSYRLGDGPGRDPDGGGPSERDGPVAGIPPLPGVAQHDAIDGDIDRQARCADPRASLTHLFFSDDPLELARARAICSICAVRAPCLRRALDRREPHGIWGGEILVNGMVVADKPGRGRPPKIARPRLVVDEVTGVPIVA